MRNLIILALLLSFSSCAPSWYITGIPIVAYVDHQKSDSITLKKGTAFYSVVFPIRSLKYAIVADTAELINIASKGFEPGGSGNPWMARVYSKKVVYLDKDSLAALRRNNDAAIEFKTKLKSLPKRKVRVFVANAK